MTDRNDKMTFADSPLGSGSDRETNAEQHHAEPGDDAGSPGVDTRMREAVGN